MTLQEYALAEADRRHAAMRLMRAEAERDLARRRRLMERERARSAAANR